MHRFSFLLVAGALLVACRDSIGPTRQRLAEQDQAEIRDLLTDPIVELALSDLVEQPTADRLRIGLPDLVGLTATAAPDRVRESVDALRGTLEPRGSGDYLALGIVALTLDQVESVLAGSGDVWSSR